MFQFDIYYATLVQNSCLQIGNLLIRTMTWFVPYYQQVAGISVLGSNGPSSNGALGVLVYLTLPGVPITVLGIVLGIDLSGKKKGLRLFV